MSTIQNDIEKTTKEEKDENILNELQNNLDQNENLEEEEFSSSLSETICKWLSDKEYNKLVMNIKIGNDYNDIVLFDNQYSIKAFFTKGFPFSQDDLIDKKLRISSYSINVILYKDDLDSSLIQRRIFLVIDDFSIIYSPSKEVNKHINDINNNRKISNLVFKYSNKYLFSKFSQINDMIKKGPFQIEDIKIENKPYLIFDESINQSHSLVNEANLVSFYKNINNQDEALNNILIDLSEVSSMYLKRNNMQEFIPYNQVNHKEDNVTIEDIKDEVKEKAYNDIPDEILSLLKIKPEISLSLFDKYRFNKKYHK